MVDADQRHAEGRQVARRAQHVPSPPMTTASEAFWPISSSEAAGNSVSPVLRAVSASTSSADRPA